MSLKANKNSLRVTTAPLSPLTQIDSRYSSSANSLKSNSVLTPSHSTSQFNYSSGDGGDLSDEDYDDDYTVS